MMKHILFFCLIILSCDSQTFTYNNTHWQSTSTFIPKNSTHDGNYGTIQLQPHMIVSLDIEWYGRIYNDTSIWEQIFRIGWPALKGDCTALNSRYPGLWIDNNHDTFHVGISEPPNDCGKGWQLVSYPITTFTIYHIHIEFTDTLVYIAINDTEIINEPRGAPTSPSYIGQLLNVYIASDYWNNPSVIANVSILNMNIISIPPTPSPTQNTDTPTYIPTSNPTQNTDTPTYIPT
eukprot:48064_1